MMSIGIFSGYYPYGLVETARRIRGAGFTCVQLDLFFKDLLLEPGPGALDKCRRVADVFRDHDLPIAAIACYKNLVHPDPAIRSRFHELVKFALKHARTLGTAYVASEAGTYHNGPSDYITDPKNFTEQGYVECRDIIAGFADYAADHDAMFLLEPYINNIIGTVEAATRISAEIPSKGFGFLIDPTNFFEAHNIDHVDSTINAIFDARFASRIKIAHAKDVKDSRHDPSEKYASMDATTAHSFRGIGGVSLPGAGLGQLNYELYLRRLSAIDPNIPIMVEHIEESDIPRAKQFLVDKLKAVGA